MLFDLYVFKTMYICTLNKMKEMEVFVAAHIHTYTSSQNRVVIACCRRYLRRRRRLSESDPALSRYDARLQVL